MSLQQIFASRSLRMKASEIRELLKLLDRPGLLSFAGGIPDPALFPAAEFAEAFQQALELSERQGEIPQLFPVLRGLSMYYQFRTDFEKATEMGAYTLSHRLDSLDLMSLESR